jgi:hypothetical protein
VMNSTVIRHSCGSSSSRLSVSKTTVTNVTAQAVRACSVFVTVATAAPDAYRRSMLRP